MPGQYWSLEAGAPAAPTASEIADALSGRYGPVVLRFRYEWRSPLYAFLGDLSPAVLQPGVITCDNGRAVVRSLALEVDPSELPDGFVPGESLIAPSCGLLVRGMWVTFELGLYRSDVARKRHYARTLGMQCSDVSAFLDKATAEPFALAASTGYDTAIEDVLDDLGLPHEIPATASVTPVAHTWGPEPTWRAVTTQIAAGLNWLPPWADRRGKLTTRDRGTDPASITEAVTYSDGDEPLMIDASGDYERSDDYQQPNQVVVVIDDPRHAGFGFVRRRNADATSLVSTANRAVDQQVLNSDSTPSTRAILDATTAQAVADYELRAAAGAAAAATLVTFLDPRRDAHENYRLQIAGVEDNTLWRVLSWRMRLEVGAPMEHRIVRAPSVTVSTP